MNEWTTTMTTIFSNEKKEILSKLMFDIYTGSFWEFFSGYIFIKKTTWKVQRIHSLTHHKKQKKNFSSHLLFIYSVMSEMMMDSLFFILIFKWWWRHYLCHIWIIHMENGCEYHPFSFTIFFFVYSIGWLVDLVGWVVFL